MRTNVAFNECKDDGIKLAPMRVIVKVLYTMNLLHGSSIAYLTKEEIKDFIFYNASVAKNKHPDIAQLIEKFLSIVKQEFCQSLLVLQSLNTNGNMKIDKFVKC